MGVPEKVLKMISKLMKTRLEVTDNGKVRVSRWINILRGFLQSDSYSSVGFCLTEVLVAMLLELTDGYKKGQPGEQDLKRTLYPSMI